MNPFQTSILTELKRKLSLQGLHLVYRSKPYLQDEKLTASATTWDKYTSVVYKATQTPLRPYLLASGAAVDLTGVNLLHYASQALTGAYTHPGLTGSHTYGEATVHTTDSHPQVLFKCMPVFASDAKLTILESDFVPLGEYKHSLENGVIRLRQDRQTGNISYFSVVGDDGTPKELELWT